MKTTIHMIVHVDDCPTGVRWNPNSNRSTIRGAVRRSRVESPTSSGIGSIFESISRIIRLYRIASFVPHYSANR